MLGAVSPICRPNCERIYALCVWGIKSEYKLQDEASEDGLLGGTAPMGPAKDHKRVREDLKEQKILEVGLSCRQGVIKWDHAVLVKKVLWTGPPNLLCTMGEIECKPCSDCEPSLRD